MEYFDLYTKERVNTGKKIQRGSKVPKGYYRMVVHICIFNSKGELLIQQRQDTKVGFANRWDMSAGGSALSGDTSLDSIQREVEEELGLILDKNEINPALTVYFDNGFNDIYIAKKDVSIEDINIQIEEVKDVKWANKNDIFKMIDDNIFVSYNKGLIELLFFMQHGNGAITKFDK